MLVWNEHARADEIWAAMESLERAGFRSQISGHGDWDNRIWMAAATNGASTWAAAADDPFKAMAELMARLGLHSEGDELLLD